MYTNGLVHDFSKNKVANRYEFFNLKLIEEPIHIFRGKNFYRTLNQHLPTDDEINPANIIVQKMSLKQKKT